MTSKRLAFMSLFLIFVITGSSPLPGKELTREQMTAYRTRPAVVLIYSGMNMKISLNNGQQFNYPYYGSGSGFYINPNGYLVTNGHVVDTYYKYMQDKPAFTQKVFDDFIMKKLAGDFQQARGRQPTERELSRSYDRYMRTYEPRIVDHAPINYVLMSNSETLRFELKKFSPSIPEGGKDIAVLKVERDNCPVIMLGDSGTLTLQQEIFTIGFPAVVDPLRFPLLGNENTLTSSITRGSISALKTDYKGMPVIQHDSATSPGNSGGPTVDAAGRVIGVHSYATREYDGFKFCVPINAAKEFILDVGIKINQTSEFTDVFNKLLNSVWEGRWYDAQTEVATAMAYMKNEPDLEKLQRLILTRINELGFFEKIWMQNRVVVIIAVILVVMIVIVLLVTFRPSPAPDEFLSSPEPQEPQEPEEPKEQEHREEPGDDRTRLEEPPADGTILEEEIFGTVSIFVKGDEHATLDITSTPLTLGRDPKGVEVLIPSEIVSKRHAKITARDGKIYISDMGSTNGTYINGEKAGATDIEVTPDDRVQLGKRGDVKLVIKTP